MAVQHRQLLASSQWWWHCLKTTETPRNLVGQGDAAVGQDVAVFLLHVLLYPVEAALADDELQSRLVLVLPVAVLVEEAQHGFDLVHQQAGGDEFVQQLRFVRQRAQSAAHHHAEAVLPVANHRAQADVVERGADAILGAAGKRDLELARHAVGEFLVQEGEGDAARVRVDVEGLVRQQTAERARGDVAHGVVAGLARSQPLVREQVEQVWHAGQRNEVVLHVLARGQVAFAGCVAVGNERELVELIGGERAAGDLGPDHLHAGLALAVDAAAQPERPKVVVGDLAGEELVGLFAEELDVLAHDGVILGFRM